MSRSLLRRVTATLVAAVAGIVTALASGAPALAAPPAWPEINQGDSGITVTTAQLLLRQRGANITADGVFGSGTDTAVRSFQSANGLTADGYVGPLTWSKLVMTVAQGASGDHVRAIQGQLNRHGYGVTVDGIFGPGTASAVTSFKTARGAGTDSTVDATTWQWLIAYGGQFTLPLAKSALPRSEYDDPHHDYPAVDLPVGTGTSAYAVTGGTVSRVDDSSCGRGIVITAGSIRYIYCHLSSWVAAAGSTVRTGQLVGYTGATGNVTGPHLHFAIKTPSTSRCPQSFLLAIYDGRTPPNPATLPTSGCFYTSFAPYYEDANV
jgi:peptidoglycan hydrolase-like protein with peptidoglycan-binding domain